MGWFEVGVHTAKAMKLSVPANACGIRGLYFPKWNMQKLNTYMYQHTGKKHGQF